MLRVIGFVLLFSISGHAADVVDISKLKEKLNYQYKSLESKTEKVDFEKTITELGKDTKEYIHFRKLECQGKYSTIEINENGQSAVKDKKLSKIEKKLCMLELINFQRKYSNLNQLIMA